MAAKKKASAEASSGVTDGAVAMSERIFSCIRSVVKVDEAVFGADATSRAMPISGGAIPTEMDYREAWWKVGDQKRTGSCVGWAVGDGLIRWYLTKKNRLSPNEQLSVRYFWMAAKETDEFQEQPTTFLEDAGTSIRTALEVVQRFGCVRGDVLPMDGGLFTDGSEAFFSLAEQLKVTGMIPIRKDPDVLRRWLAREGPIAARLLVDRTFFTAQGKPSLLDQYDPFPQFTFKMGHAVVLAGYLADGTFILRNSWGASQWGDRGFAYATEAYLMAAFSEFFGVFS